MLNKEEQFTFKAETLESNLKRISLLNKIYLTIISVILILYILVKVPFSQFNCLDSISWLLYFIVLIVSSIYVYLLDFKKIKVIEGTYKRFKYLEQFYIAFFLIFAALLSIIQHNLNFSIFVYSLILFSSIPFLVITSKEIIMPLSISSVIFLIGWEIHLSNLFMPVVYILTLSVIAFFLSRSAYFVYSASYNLRIEKSKEVQYLKNLTEVLKETNRQLEQDASLDPLTNLYNRRAYNDYLILLQQRILESPQSISVIMVDVDCFKLFNDTYGHAEGDKALGKIGSLLHAISIEYKCFVARWGGEEFVLILPNELEATVENICYQIREGVYDLNIEHQSSTIDNVVTVSIGACSKTITELNEIFECISEADSALYSVKDKGRNSFEYRHQIHA